MTPSPNQASQEDSFDERLIRTGIEAALRDGTDIDDRTAARIAFQLHDGQGSALYSLASTGNITPDIDDQLTCGYLDFSEQAQAWINWLGEYCLHRPDKGPVTGWQERTADRWLRKIPRPKPVPCSWHGSTWPATTLGQVATVTTTEQSAEGESTDYAYTCEDAMRWYPENAPPPETCPCPAVWAGSDNCSPPRTRRRWCRLARRRCGRARTSEVVDRANGFLDEHAEHADLLADPQPFGDPEHVAELARRRAAEARRRWPITPDGRL